MLTVVWLSLVCERRQRSSGRGDVGTWGRMGEPEESEKEDDAGAEEAKIMKRHQQDFLCTAIIQSRDATPAILLLLSLSLSVLTIKSIIRRWHLCRRLSYPETFRFLVSPSINAYVPDRRQWLRPMVRRSATRLILVSLTPSLCF